MMRPKTDSSFLIAFLLWLMLPTSVLANDTSGKVCFGKNLAKPLSEHSDRLYLKIDNSDILYFNRPHSGPVVRKLDIAQKHRVKVYYDDRLVESWVLDFSVLNTQAVIIWRAPGSWRMDPANGNCQ